MRERVFLWWGNLRAVQIWAVLSSSSSIQLKVIKLAFVVHLSYLVGSACVSGISGVFGVTGFLCGFFSPDSEIIVCLAQVKLNDFVS